MDLIEGSHSMRTPEELVKGLHGVSVCFPFIDVGEVCIGMGSRADVYL